MIRLASINIEGSRHLPEVEQFIASQQPDVVCLQEVFTQDLAHLEEAFHMKSFHTINADVTQENPYMATNGTWGLAIFSRWPLSRQQEHFYVGSPEEIPVLQKGNPNSMRRGVQVVELSSGAEQYRLANTHLTWTPDGSVTKEQRHDAQQLQSFLKQFSELILVGDFNAPRGKATWKIFADQYQDNIPPEITSTLDPDLHRAGALPFVVDTLFTTPQYRVKNVEIHTGVSDHRAIVADISLT